MSMKEGNDFLLEVKSFNLKLFPFFMFQSKFLCMMNQIYTLFFFLTLKFN